MLQIWLPLPLPALDYLAPMASPTVDPPAGPVDGSWPLGARVAVSWQGGLRVGIVGAVREARSAETLDLRPAVAFLDTEPWLLPPALQMIEAQARRCVVPLGLALSTAHPLGLKGPWEHRVRLLAGAVAEAPLLIPPVGDGGEDAGDATPGIWREASELPSESLDLWRAHGLLEEEVNPIVDTERVLTAVRPEDDDLQGKPKEAQRRALAYLHLHGPMEAGAAGLARDAAVPVSAARGLVTKGYAAYTDRPKEPPPAPWVMAEEAASVEGGVAGEVAAGHVLGAFSPAGSLVSGGDASSRLAALLPALGRELRSGGQVLFLIPEHAGSEQLTAQVARHLPTLRWGPELDDAQRLALREALVQGTPAVVLGTYPILSLPVPALRAVVVWDAASASHKQLAGARSVGRSDALVLADAAGAGWALVDALPTAELGAMAASEELRLPRPALRAVVVDVKQERGWPISTPLLRLLRQVVERERQAVLLVPRRGYAAALACGHCGEAVPCPHCAVPLRWHARAARLRCHLCGHQQAAPHDCPACGAPDLAPRPGAGTEWVAETVQKALPGTRVLSWDRDRREDLSAMLAGEPGVVVGTVALLRAPPLPKLSLVAVTSGDALLDHEDLRAEEDALRTLLQLPEISGSARRPLLLSQVQRTEHQLWRTWTSDDLDQAVDELLGQVAERREAFGYPPFRRWARVQLSHREPARAALAAQGVVDRLHTAGLPEEDVLGPAPAPVAKVRGRYAFHLFVRAKDEAELIKRLAEVDQRPGGGVQLRIDVDPFDISAFLD